MGGRVLLMGQTSVAGPHSRGLAQPSGTGIAAPSGTGIAANRKPFTPTWELARIIYEGHPGLRGGMHALVKYPSSTVAGP